MTKRLTHTLNDVKHSTSRQVSLKDIYWLAGMLEGEGSFTAVTKRPKVSRISFVSTDLDIVLRVSSLLESTLSVRDRRHYSQGFGSLKTIYSTQLAGRRAVGWMMTIYSLMGQRRKTRIRGLLSDWRS